MTEEAEVYRLYDQKGILLYVGVSYNAIRRLTGHRHYAHTWINEVTWIEIERFETYDSALMAEKLAIRQERPLHNTIHSDLRKRRLPDAAAFRIRLENLLESRRRRTRRAKPGLIPDPDNAQCNATLCDTVQRKV